MGLIASRGEAAAIAHRGGLVWISLDRAPSNAPPRETAS
jgi:hypothetical protein